MSAAATGTEQGWAIPAYVWPPVLGASVALHLSVLVFGLAEMRLPQQDPAELTETEIIIESGGVAFEDVVAAPPLQPEMAAVEAVNVSASEVAETTPASGEVNELQPVASDVLAASVPASDIVESVGVLSVPGTNPVEAVTAEVPDVTPVAPETAILSQVEAAETIEVIEAGPAEVAQVLEPGGDIPLAPVTDSLPADPSTLAPSDVADVVPSPVTPADSPTVAESAVIEPVTVSQGTDGLISEDVLTIVSSATEAQPIASVGIEPVGPAAVPVFSVTEPEPETVIAANAGITPVASVEIEAVSPAQEVTAVQPAETVVAAISPSEPDASAVPTVAPPSEPAESVPPVEIATIDPLARITNYVETYDFGDCAHLSVLAAGSDSASVTAFGSGIDPFVRFDKRFSADQGYEAAIELRLVTSSQCGLLNALGLSEGIEAAGLVELDGTVVRSGSHVTGVIRRDLPLKRIAAAEQTGLDLSGKGPPELYLIDDAGQIHDGREFLLPVSSARTAGAWRFKVPVTLMASQSEETALVLAIWNRPASRQPPRFRVQPSARITDILAQPGVYSLSAFKVSP
ncbi:hypothetical protein [Roseibium sp.]|uniref:hypothetical protein n=2 Tax=Roseibium sp. TaxID=1936156 RepID=UPI003263560C